MADFVQHRQHGWSDRHTTASRAARLSMFMVLSLIPGVIAVGLGRSPFAVFWLVVFTALAIGVAAALLPSSDDRQRTSFG
ncbi:Integral membrane protein [Prescottella defluvii]|uniref:hypothetical protein n=1 Tax=Prescottella defluvii TaxID=1323361 RepID=UPI0004F3E697|nr:hypothetical protein [Prescottella defluvii]